MTKNSIRLWAAFTILSIFVGGSVLLLSRLIHRWTPHPPRPLAAYSPGVKPSRSGADREEWTKPTTAPNPQVAIVVDDLGESEQDVQSLLDINIPLTFAVLPQRPFSRSIAQRLHSLGSEIILHLPLEPEDKDVNLGKGMLLLSMPREELLSRLRENLDSLPYLTGVNNHMGSAFTANEEGMRVVLGELKERGLFFLDNRTTAETVGLKVARELGVRAAERSVFLDNEEDPEYISSQLDKLIRMAREKGSAVGTCHPSSTTIRVLTEKLPEFSAQGIDFVPVSALVR